MDSQLRAAWPDLLDAIARSLNPLQQDVERLEKRNAYLEAELKREEQHHTIALKEIVTLKQQLAKRRQLGVRRRLTRA
jgi:cell division septum initiation protein DivIVA